MNVKRIYKEALPGQPKGRTSVDEDRWMINVVCHTKSNHKFVMMGWIDKELMGNDSFVAGEVRRMQRHARLAVDMHNNEVAEKAKKKARKAA